MERAFATSALLLALIFSPVTGLDRSQFPPGFLFGTSTSHYQIEGAYLEGNKSLSNWDVFTHTSASILDGSNGDVADDHYHRYKEDVELIHALGVNSFRLSLSWSRILPRGRFGDINPTGIRFYHNLIDALLLKGIQPFVTLHHYDIPQELEDRYGGWLHRQLIEEFAYFAEVCFSDFGEKVEHWTTFNEPNSLARLSYMSGKYHPNRCSEPFGRCHSGDSYREPYIAAHSIILSHATAINIYKTKYKEKQGGSIGIVVSAPWFEPFSDTVEDQSASARVLSFDAAGILDPVIHGDYPPEMRKLLGSRLPRFTSEEKILLVNSSDFIGLNHYMSSYVKDCIYSSCEFDRYYVDALVESTGSRDGPSTAPQIGLPDEFIFPSGMKKIVMFVTQRYKNVPIFITENGYPHGANNDASSTDLDDMDRIENMRSYLTSLSNAMRKGADVRGYFVWSLMDNFEWLFGYTLKFGLYHVNFTTQERIPRLSARWYKDFIQGSQISDVAALNHSRQCTSK